jgi:hypothetical protein
LLALLPGSSRANAGGEAAFEWLKSLEVEWEGTHEWTGAINGAGPVRASYRMTGNGSALMENLGDGSTTRMTSVYHLDGRELRMSHFCTGNQPRLKARDVKPAVRRLHFEFVDATNLEEGEAHVRTVQVELTDQRHLRLRFGYGSGEEKSIWALALTRRSDSPPGGKNPTAAMARVLEADTRLGEVRKHASESTPLHVGIEAYARDLEEHEKAIWWTWRLVEAVQAPPP